MEGRRCCQCAKGEGELPWHKEIRGENAARKKMSGGGGSLALDIPLLLLLPSRHSHTYTHTMQVAHMSLLLQKTRFFVVSPRDIIMGNGESAFALQQFGWGGGKKGMFHTRSHRKRRRRRRRRRRALAILNSECAAFFLCLPPPPPPLFSPCLHG